MQNLIVGIQSYGIKEGLRLYLKIKLFEVSSIKPKDLSTIIFLRPNSTDKCAFKQIFLKRDFDIEILNKIKPEVIIDLGANIGMSSLYFANRFKDALVIGVEPDKDNASMFTKNLEHYPNARLEVSAVLGTNEKVELIDNGRGASGYVTQISESDFDSITVADIISKYKLDQIDILKIDVEGSEKSIFSKNYESWLPQVKVLLIELHERKEPGCTEVLYQAITKYRFKMEKSGEYHVFVNQDCF